MSLSRNTLLGTAGIILLSITLFIVRYYDMLFSYKILGNSNDSVHLLGPVFKHVNDLSRSGQKPLFFQELVGGIPFYNSAMFSFTYPFYFFNVVDYGDGMDVLRTITLIIAFHLFVLFVSNIVLLRVIGFNWIISVLASFGIILCLNTAYNTPWIIAIAGYAWTPLFFAGIILCIQKPKSYLGVILLTIGSLGFLAKPAQTAILALVFGAVIAFVGMYVKRKNISSILLNFVVAGLLILGINAPGLLQVFIDFPDMMRFTTGGAVQGNMPIPLEAYMSEVAFSQVGNYILYMTKSMGVGHPFAGPIAIASLFCSIFFIVSKKIKADWMVKTFLGITIFTILIAFGKSLPTFWIHYKAPLLNKIRESTRFLFITNIGLTVLMAYTFQSIKTHWDNSYIKWIAIAILSAGIFFLFAQIGLNFRNLYWMLASIPLIGLTYFFHLKKPKFSIWLAAIAVVLISFSFLVPNGRYGKKGKEKGFEKTENLSAMATFDQLLTKVEDPNLYRCMYTDKNIRDGEWSNKGLYNGFRSLQGTTVVLPFNQYEELWHSDKFMNYRLLWGCRWHIYGKEEVQPTDDKNFTKLLSNKHHSVYTHKQAFPRAYFSRKVIPFNGNWKQFRKKLKKYEKLPRNSFVHKDIIAEKNLSLAPQSNNKVEKISYFDNALTVTTEQKTEGLLVLNEYISPHWKVKVNGVDKEIIKVNVNQMAVMMPKGSNELILEYIPKPFMYFYWLQKICFVILGLITAIFLFKFFTNREVREKEHEDELAKQV